MTKIQLRRDTAANWSTNNPTPSAGEPCFETDTGKLKIGDGTTAYNDLAYQGGGSLEICDIGIALYVDETKGLRRYLNGQIVDINTNTQAFLDRLKQITTLHPSLLCTEEEWQTAKTMSALGQVGKFVFNYNGEEIVSVRLPRVVNIQGLFDLQNLGMTVSAGLPNITGNIGSIFVSTTTSGSGALSGWNTKKTKSAISDGSNNAWGIFKFDASRSNPIYGNSTTVQPEAIQYPYFIQIATGQETENNIVNEIELNNPYSLFDSKYSDHELNNLSWLKSEGQWNSKTVYPTAYGKLLKVYNGTETVEGLSVKLSTETYTDYDFVLNTADETFRLPLLDGSEDLPSFSYKTLTLQNDTGDNNYNFNVDRNSYIVLRSLKMAAGANSMIRLQTDSGDIAYCTGNSSGTNSAGVSVFARRGDSVNVGTFGAWGTLDTFRQYYATGNGSLYYYVGETVQNANLIDAGRIGEQLANKVDLDAQNLSTTGKSFIGGLGMPSNKYIDLTLGASGATYTAPADGWFTINKHGTAGAIASFENSSAAGITWISSLATETDCRISCPAKKGDEVRLWYLAAGITIYFRFVYAVGSEPTA